MKDIVAVVAAAAHHRGIGYKGTMPWRLPGDLKHFQRVTTTVIGKSSSSSSQQQNAVIMGRKTWESLPEKFRPLPGRLNVVLSRNDSNLKPLLSSIDNDDESSTRALHANSLETAIDVLQKRQDVGTIFIIGGGQIYEQALNTGKSNIVNKVIYTEVLGAENLEFDAFFPELPESEWDRVPFTSTTATKDPSKDDTNSNNNMDKENGSNSMPGIGKSDDVTLHKDAKSGLEYRFVQFTRRDSSKGKQQQQPTVAETTTTNNMEELQYLDVCRDIISKGIRRGDRTGTGTLSQFGVQMRYSLRDGTLPLLTTKRVFWRGVAEELLWFISGNTNANVLAEKNIHIWDGNGSREFLDNRGLGHREEGDLGPVYGFQWRHFGAKYKTMHDDYSGQGVDQLAACIDKIKNHPEDRRIVLSAWNPADLDEMALPPCHMFCQFYVDIDKNELSCQMYQRSADMGLGVPFNIASYALLTHLMAHVTGRKAGDFVHTIGDAHVYLNHVEALETQLERTPRAFPKLAINPSKTDIDDFVMEDLTVTGYDPHKSIKMKMAV